jgi:hypothetical protein
VGIGVKIAVVRVLLAEVVARMNRRFMPRQHLLQLLDERFEVGAGEFSAELKDQSWYLAHGGESLGNLASSANKDLRRETSPLSSFLVKPDPARSASRPRQAQQPTIRSEPRGESRNRCSAQSIQ